MKLIYMNDTISYMQRQGDDCQDLIKSGVIKHTEDKYPYLIFDIL